MCVKAIQIDDTAHELYFRILALILSEDEERRNKWISYGDITDRLNKQGGQGEQVTQEVVRYNIKKLVSLGYLRKGTKGYEATEKVLFLKQA